jgi:hypothetical protein
MGLSVHLAQRSSCSSVVEHKGGDEMSGVVAIVAWEFVDWTRALSFIWDVVSHVCYPLTHWSCSVMPPLSFNITVSVKELQTNQLHCGIATPAPLS